MDDFFGGSLIIKDAFSSTFQQFTGGITKASSGFKMFTNQIGQSERANRLATQNMRSQITQLAQAYIQQGYTMQQALRKATSEIQRDSPNTGNAWVNAFGRIKQVGVDAFSSIGSKIESFSHSTLGLVTKLTAGFLSVKTVTEGLKQGFETGMEYQNGRILMNSLYGSKEKGKEKFDLATNFSQSTMWSETEVVKALSEAKGIGLGDDEKSLKLYSDLGSFAKAGGAGDITSSVDAIGDMMNGEWERLQTILSIKRVDLEKFAKSNNMRSFDNKQGQITNKDALMDVFKKYVDTKGITGLTEEMGKTATGRLSTLTSGLKKSLAELVGITSSGDVKPDSLFDKFCKGMETFIDKTNKFAESNNFNKISNALGDIGGAISSGFSYLMEHPEIASGLLKLSIGLWSLGKIGSAISTVTTIVGAFGEGGVLASFGAALAPIAPYVLAGVGALMAFSSILSPDGILHKSISWFLEKIPVVGESLQSGFESSTSGISEIIQESIDGWGYIFGNEPKNNTKDAGDLGDDPAFWYTGKYTKASDKNLQYKTASDLVKDGTITKTDTSKSVTSKTDVHVNIEKVEKTADVDELMDTVVKRIDKHAQTRNNLDD